MAKVLRLDTFTRQQVNEACATLLKNLHKADPDIALDIANSIWVRKGLNPNPSFEGRMRDCFSAKVSTVDFAAEAAKLINGWVSESTRGRIKEIVDSPIPDDAAMYLINAVYMKAPWSMTRRARFCLWGRSSTRGRIELRIKLRDRLALRVAILLQRFLLAFFEPELRRPVKLVRDNSPRSPLDMNRRDPQQIAGASFEIHRPVGVDDDMSRRPGKIQSEAARFQLRAFDIPQDPRQGRFEANLAHGIVPGVVGRLERGRKAIEGAQKRLRH
jgi:hypothetical protein